MKEPAPDQGAGALRSCSETTLANPRHGMICPNANACRSVAPHPILTTGAACRLCGQWLNRSTLSKMLAGVPA